MNLLKGWRTELLGIDDCPWPGPRPMRDRDAAANALQGRDDDAYEFAKCVRDHRVAVLTGASGVGKTSALHVKVRPQLEDSGFAVMLCDTWNPPDDFDAETLIEARVSADRLPRGVRLGADRASLVDQLDRYYPDRAVVILDQFEELIRYRGPEVYRKVLQWISEIVESSRVRIVVSLRIEYEHELAGPGGLKIGPWDLTRYELAPVTESADIEKIIRSGTTPVGEPAASEEAVIALRDAWAETFDAGWSEVGLLHLQASLYTLWHTKKSDGVEVADVDDMIKDAKRLDSRSKTSNGVKLFEYALSKSVEVALDHCRRACPPAGVDDLQATRARELVVEMAGHLSSGGYKVSLNRDELADRVVKGAHSRKYLRELRHAREALASVVDKAADERDPDKLDNELDWLAVSRTKLFDNAETQDGPDSGPPQAGRWPWQLDPDDDTGGALLGLRPTESAIEEMRSFHFALEWLRICELIRVTSTEPGKSMVSLIHDRFAAGLERWREDPEQSMGITEAIARVSAIKGEILNWSSDNHAVPPIVANVRWTGCIITRELTRTTFVNCDFRGSTFKACRFDGVSFVNCLLDDVEFLDCVIVRRPDALPETLTKEQKEEPPAFHVKSPELVQVLNRYRETHVEGTMLFSRTAGVAAIPASDGHTHKRLVPFINGDHRELPKGLGLPQPGGLTMFGGRLSSLKFRSCTFPDGGML
jgi:hypothetical protein